MLAKGLAELVDLFAVELQQHLEEAGTVLLDVLIQDNIIQHAHMRLHAITEIVKEQNHLLHIEIAIVQYHQIVQIMLVQEQKTILQLEVAHAVQDPQIAIMELAQEAKHIQLPVAAHVQQFQYMHQLVIMEHVAELIAIRQLEIVHVPQPMLEN